MVLLLVHALPSILLSAFWVLPLNDMDLFSAVDIACAAYILVRMASLWFAGRRRRAIKGTRIGLARMSDGGAGFSSTSLNKKKGCLAMPLSIAIDGPSASGKSTLAKALAEKYGFIYIDTGALYRTVGLYVHELCLSSQDAEAIVAALPEIHIEMQLRDGRGEVYLNGRPVGDEIRTPVCSLYASDVSKLPEVRAFLLPFRCSATSRPSTTS